MGWKARSGPAWHRSVGSALGLRDGTCSTMKTDAGKWAGNACTSILSASTPPAEAPITMISCPDKASSREDNYQYYRRRLPVLSHTQGRVSLTFGDCWVYSSDWFLFSCSNRCLIPHYRRALPKCEDDPLSPWRLHQDPCAALSGGAQTQTGAQNAPQTGLIDSQSFSYVVHSDFSEGVG